MHAVSGIRLMLFCIAECKYARCTSMRKAVVSRALQRKQELFTGVAGLRLGHSSLRSLSLHLLLPFKDTGSVLSHGGSAHL